jgi:hypothetical protein
MTSLGLRQTRKAKPSGNPTKSRESAESSAALEIVPYHNQKFNDQRKRIVTIDKPPR